MPSIVTRKQKQKHQTVTSVGLRLVAVGSRGCALSSWQTQSMRAGSPPSGGYALTNTSLSSAGTRPH